MQTHLGVDSLSSMIRVVLLSGDGGGSPSSRENLCPAFRQIRGRQKTSKISWFFLKLLFYFIFNFYFLATLCGMWDLSSLARDWTCAPCSGRVESLPLDCQGILIFLFLFLFIYLFIYFWPHHVACRFLAPWPGIEPRPWQWKHGVLTTGPPGNSPKSVDSQLPSAQVSPHDKVVYFEVTPADQCSLPW